MTVLASHDESPRSRLNALKETQALVAQDPGLRDASHRVYSDIAWTYSEPVALRVGVLQAMIDDPDPKAAADAKDTVKLLLPRERSLEVVRFISRAAAERGWDDCIPSLIRSYSRTPASIGWVGVNKESDRPERAALSVLSKGAAVERVVFQAFLKPPAQVSTYGTDWAQRFRADAWDLLARLDTDGTLRASMLSEVPEVGADDLVLDIQRCVRELRAMPRTGDELKWLMSLVDPNKRANAVWWGEAAKAIASIGEDGRNSSLSLRHAEPIRWAAAKHPQWLQATRQELLSELRTRLGRRTIHERSAESGQYRIHEQLVAWETKLRWGDLISILAIDEAIREPSVTRAFLTQAELDRKDDTTEYGGVLMLRSALGGASRPTQTGDEWIAVLFPPRAGQREGDEKFVASADMITTSDQALAHYHMHAQKSRNSEFAGPSPGDLLYAAHSGRACVVLTTVYEGKIDADYYQPDGAVIDLGELGQR
jgi:hypothetical protein